MFEVGSNRLIEGFNRPNEVTPSRNSYVRTAASLFQGADRQQLQLHDRVSSNQAATGPNTRSLKGSATLSSLASASSESDAQLSKVCQPCLHRVQPWSQPRVTRTMPW